nr:RHS repeat protein [Desulfobacterales bacterium]
MPSERLISHTSFSNLEALTHCVLEPSDNLIKGRLKMTKSGKIHTFPLFALTLILIGILCPLGAFAATRADFGPLKAASIQIISIKLLGNEAFFIPPGETGQLEAETYPENLKEEIRWAVTGRNGDVDVELDPRTGFLTISENSGSGWIRVQAEAERCRPRTQRIEIGCGCAGGSGQCHLIAGAGNVANGSIDVRISFGKTREGRWAGDLFLFAKEPLAELSTPEALFINSTSDQVIPLYRDDILEQIVTPQTIITFARFSPQEYEIYFYDIAERGQQLENGLYSIDLTAEPMAIWRIENPDGSGETVDQLAVTEIRGGKQRNFLYVYTAGEKGWTLVSDSGRKIDVKKETTDDDGDRVARRVISGADNEPVSVEETVYHQFEFGEKRIRKIIDPDGAGLTTAYHYETSRGPGYGKLKARTDADGSWVRYEYDETGRIVREIKPFLDAGIDAPAEKTVVVTRSYAAVDAADSRAERDRYRPRRVIEAINGIETARTYYVYIKEADDSRTEITERCTGQGKSYGDSTNLRTEASYYGTKVKSPASGKIKSSLSADGRLATYTYENGQFRLSPDPARSFFIPGKGKALRTTVTHGTAKHPEGLPFQTTRETTITDSLGQEKMQETFVRTEAGDERIGWQFNAHNRLGQLTETLYANRTRTEIEWGCCGKVSTTDVSGITTRYTYDDLKRVTARINEATGVVTAYTYDAVGRRLTSTEKKDDLSRTQESRYDRAGRLVAQVDAAGLVTRHSTDKTISTTIRPGGATEITTRHLDGRIHASTGTAVVPRFYRYGVNRDGRRWTTVFVGDQDSPRWEKTTRDVAGRIIKVEKPGFTGLDVTTNAYDRFGRIIRTTSSGTGGMLHIYDALGSRIQSGLDVDGDGKLTPASMDRISTEISAYTRIEGDWWHEQKSAIYAHDSSDKKTTVSIRRSRLSGWKDQLIAEDLAIDIHGNETHRFEFLDRFNRKRIQTIHFADFGFSAQSIIVDGRIVESTSQTGLTVRYGYDALGRRNAVMEPRTGLSTLGYDEKGRIAYREDAAGNRTRYVYDPASGQKTAEYNPHGQASRYAYDAKGRLTRTWGDVPYPVEYAFGPYGEMVSMQTFRSGAGWKGKNWPADTGPPDTTRWHYQAETGLLLAKEDAGGNQTIYAYGAGNRLTRRTWARPVDGQALFTRYSYNDKTGDLKKVDYSDDTVDIEFLYDRTGRRKQIIDAGGTRTFQYNRNLQLASENLAGRLSYRMERAYDALGRNAGFALDAHYGIAYTYDPTGRFKSVRWQVNHQRGQADYSYRKDSNLLTGLSMNAGVRVFYDYEP